VLAGVGHAHSHHCLDGQEPAVTVHFENLAGHTEHHPDENHVDVEKELVPQALPGKAPDQHDMVFLLAFSLLLCRLTPQRQQCSDNYQPLFLPSPPDLLPPLRAPPTRS
jgi:hypothetical protein